MNNEPHELRKLYLGRNRNESRLVVERPKGLFNVPWLSLRSRRHCGGLKAICSRDYPLGERSLDMSAVVLRGQTVVLEIRSCMTAKELGRVRVRNRSAA